MLYELVHRLAVEYTLAQSFIPETKLSIIEQKTLPQIYSKCGYNHNMSKKSLQAPREVGGAGLLPLTACTGSGFVIHFLKHWRCPHEQAGNLMRITLSWFQYQVGVSYAGLTNPSPKLVYVQSNFIPVVRDYLCTIHGTIEVDTPYIYPKLRTNDIPIMEAAQLLELTDIQIQRLNQVRMYLGFM